MVRPVLFVGVLFLAASAAAQNTSTRPAEAAPAPTRDQARPVERAQPAPAGDRSVAIRTLEPRPVTVAESRGQLAARRAGQPVNVKVEVTFHDQTGNEPRRTKTLSVVTADGLTGFVRTVALYEGAIGQAPLNMDVEPRILTGGKIRVLLNLQYTLPALATERRSPNEPVLRSTEIRENLSLVLEDGKPLVVAQSADPVGDRKVTVEVVASIPK